MIRDMPFLIKRLLRFMRTREGFFFLFKYIIRSHYLIILVMYILSPIDILPEIIFGIFGLIDDILVFVLIIFLICNIYYSYSVI